MNDGGEGEKDHAEQHQDAENAQPHPRSFSVMIK